MARQVAAFVTEDLPDGYLSIALPLCECRTKTTYRSHCLDTIDLPLNFL
jgi:hypothetical protein